MNKDLQNISLAHCAQRLSLLTLGGMLLNVPLVVQAQSQQSGTCKGVVVDENGEVLPGVFVVAMQGKKMVASTTTDADGNYTLAVPRGAQLRVSFIGYEPQTLAPQFDQQARIVLKEANAINETVVNGFFTRNKASFTGSVKSLKQEELLQVSQTSLLQALVALDPAVNITPNNAMGSNPNAVPELVLRSTSSLATSGDGALNRPLVIIDGVKSSLEALYDIDLHDIARVDILKDASATALYGEDAANGVIVIERNKVSQAPVRVRYTFTPQVSFADLSSYELMNARQKLEFERIAGRYNSPTGEFDQDYYDKLAMVNRGTDVNWKSQPIRNSFSHLHSISLTGRGSGLDYSLTGNFGNTQGVMKGDSRQRMGLAAYFAYRAVKDLVVSIRAAHQEISSQDSPYGNYNNWLRANPYDSPYDSEGNLRRLLSYDFNNPLYEASLSSFAKSKTRTQTLNIDARYNFQPNFYLTALLGFDSSEGTNDAYLSPESGTYARTTNASHRGSYTLGNSHSNNWMAKLVANYTHAFDKAGTQLTLNAGGELKSEHSVLRTSRVTGFLTDQLASYGYATNYADGAPTGTDLLARNAGAFVAANFIYRNRYFAEGSYRVSGSSKFGANNKYAPFWAIGGGYNLHNEEFLKPYSWINTLRLRSSYGHTGSVKFSAYQALSTYAYDAAYVHYTGIGANPKSMANPDLTWQTTQKFNIGLTSEFFNNRLTFNFDLYRELTTDMLIDVSLPPSAGEASVPNNLGRQRNVGFEFQIFGKILQQGDWQWSVSANGLHNRSKILGINSSLERRNRSNANSNLDATPRILFQEGSSPTAIFAVRSAGIDPASGQEIFIKKDGTRTFTYDATDKVEVGDRQPDLIGGFATQIVYKRFTLNLGFSYTLGGDTYNSTRAARIENVDSRYNADLRAFTDRWKQTGDVVPYLTIAREGGTRFQHTSRFVENENELALANASLQYDFSNAVCKRLGVQKLYISLGMTDLFRLSTVRYERGTSYPFSRSLVYAVSVTF